MNFKSIAIGAAALLLPNVADAAPVLWTLNNAVFADDGTATGTFTWDADTGLVGDYHFIVGGGDTDTFEPTEYSSADPGAGVTYQAFLDGAQMVYLFDFSITVPTGVRSLYISTASALTSAGGNVALDFTSRYAAGECFSCNPYRPFASGSVTGQGVSGGVPEPGTWALMMLGFGAAGATLRRRRVQLATAA